VWLLSTNDVSESDIFTADLPPGFCGLKKQDFHTPHSQIRNDTEYLSWFFRTPL
jgi:hypothetical protein